MASSMFLLSLIPQQQWSYAESPGTERGAAVVWSKVIKPVITVKPVADGCVLNQFW